MESDLGAFSNNYTKKLTKELFYYIKSPEMKQRKYAKIHVFYVAA